jgi:hypothetical protein
MDAGNSTKINKLLQETYPGTVMTSTWLKEKGYSSELIRNYKKSKWLKAFGNGAVVRYNDKIDYLGATYTMQTQLAMSIHPSARTALSLLGRAHYLELNQNHVYLFADEKEVLPTWFKKHEWKPNIAYYTSSFLPPKLGMTTLEHKGFKVIVSTPARAFLECLYISPKEMDFIECHQLMEGLTGLVPSHLQELLEKCTSVKVKRLFFYLADKSNHSWLKHLNRSKIDLGKGNRSFVKQGKYISKYKITVPVELEEDELRGI